MDLTVRTRTCRRVDKDSVDQQSHVVSAGLISAFQVTSVSSRCDSGDSSPVKSTCLWWFDVDPEQTQIKQSVMLRIITLDSSSSSSSLLLSVGVVYCCLQASWLLDYAVFVHWVAPPEPSSPPPSVPPLPRRSVRCHVRHPPLQCHGGRGRGRDWGRGWG